MIQWLGTAVVFTLFYAKEVIISNLRVAKDALSPRPHLRPGIVGIPVEGYTDRQVWALASLLTMTPGSISLEVDETRRVLYLHTLYTEPTAAELRAQIQRDYERPIRILF
jgi:multicomponent Na+:H+ antiporter subunit E